MLKSEHSKLKAELEISAKENANSAEENRDFKLKFKLKTSPCAN